jgi:hypothetical protein
LLLLLAGMRNIPWRLAGSMSITVSHRFQSSFAEPDATPVLATGATSIDERSTPLQQLDLAMARRAGIRGQCV